MRRRVLVLTRDLIPVEGSPTSGGGIRAWGLGEALRSAGHDVVYSVPTKLVPEGDAFDEMRRLSFDPQDLHTTILRAEPDILLLEQWGLATHLPETNLPVVLDLHGSLILENAYRRHRSWTSNAAAKIKALRRADLVTCPGDRQLAYFMPWLMMSGADPTDMPVEVVPVSMPPEQPERTANADQPLQVVYGGQLWPWIEPGAGLVAATEALEEMGEGTLSLFVNEPANQDVMPYDDSTRAPAWRLPARVLNSDVVNSEGMVPREEMIQRYTAAHLAIDLYGWNTERELAFTTRTVEYLWCGLPVIYGHYGELSKLIRQYEAGWVVDPSNMGAVRATVKAALSDREELQRRSENARRLVAERLSWDKTVAPLDAFVQDPCLRDKGETIFGKLSLEFDRLKSEARERFEPMEHDLKKMVDEVANRDARIVALTDELATRERLAAEEIERRSRSVSDLEREKGKLEDLLREGQLQSERRGIEVDEREREIRKLAASVETAQARSEELEQQLAEARDLLHCEQSDHANTAASAGTMRNDLHHAEQKARDMAGELERVKVDLKGAVARLASDKEEFDSRTEAQCLELTGLRNLELELRRDLAAEAAASDEAKSKVELAEQGQQQLQAQLKSMRRKLRDMRNSWGERTMATGQHTLRRVAYQVPSVAGLWVRNLANNAYMTVWQRRHNVKIFPGQ